VKVKFHFSCKYHEANMFADQQKAKCVLWYAFYESSAVLRRKFKTFYHVHYHQTPRENAILCRSLKFKETGSLVL
jgi:hypothetical protein